MNAGQLGQFTVSVVGLGSGAAVAVDEGAGAGCAVVSSGTRGGESTMRVEGSVTGGVDSVTAGEVVAAPVVSGDVVAAAAGAVGDAAGD